jgi:hypothetical protein
MSGMSANRPARPRIAPRRKESSDVRDLTKYVLVTLLETIEFLFGQG